MNMKINYNLEEVQTKDKEMYYNIKKATCEEYVKIYFGTWNEKEQKEYNNDIFNQSLKQTYFKSIVVNKKIVGFFGYSVSEKEIGCVTLQIVNIKGRAEIFAELLSKIIMLSNKLNLPIYAKSFLDSKDINIYKNAGFEIMEKTNSHYLLIRRVSGGIMQRKDYETFVKNRFEGKTKELMLSQINNFYNIASLNFKNKKYRLGEDVVLNPRNLMTGFKLDFEYLDIISKEGKICGDYAEIETKHGVRWAVSTWKFAKKIKLKDYITQYSGMTVVYNGNYEIVPYGQLDTFVEKLKKKEHFLWEAESTREMRFLPNDIRQNGNVALIFNVGHKQCEELLKNELQQEFIPEEIRLSINPNDRNKTRILMEKGFGERCAYIIFGIPRNCIEGLFVNRQVEKNKKQLLKLKSIFPDCYICNLDGKVIVE